jgi:hypothetical protein
MSLTNGNRTDKTHATRKSFLGRVPADWENVPADAIRDCIVQISRMGGAVRFGYSRDGGAYSIGVYGLEPSPFTDYLRPGDDVQAYLDTLSDQARNIAAAPIGQHAAAKPHTSKPDVA